MLEHLYSSCLHLQLYYITLAYILHQSSSYTIFKLCQQCVAVPPPYHTKANPASGIDVGRRVIDGHHQLIIATAGPEVSIKNSHCLLTTQNLMVSAVQLTVHENHSITKPAQNYDIFLLILFVFAFCILRFKEKKTTVLVRIPNPMPIF